MTDRTTLRVAVIGAGMIASAHVRAARDAGAEVVGILGSSPASSESGAARMGIDRGYSSLAELVADEPDVVHICSPNSSHAAYAEALAPHGIHLVIEKPIGTTLEEATRIRDIVRSSGVVATVPYVYRYHPLVRELRARRERGDFGDVVLVHGSYLQDWLLAADSSTWRVDAAEGGASRAFADIGSHWCDLAEFVSGERFASVTASTQIVHAERPAPSGPSFGGSGEEAAQMVPVTTEDITVATFRTERGMTANTVISQVSAGRKNRLWLEVDGTERSAVFDQEEPESVWIGEESGATILRRGEGSPLPEQARLNRTPSGHPQGWTDAFSAFVADTYAAVQGHAPDGLPTVEDGLRSVAIVDAVLRSAHSSEWTEVTS